MGPRLAMMLELRVDDLVMRGYDDWIQAADVASVAMEVGGAESAEAIRWLSLQIIRRVVERGLMELGDLDVVGFRKWDLPTRDGLNRVEREWNALGRNPNAW